MKKKNYFIISAILQIIGAIYIIINANSIIQTQLELAPETYSMFSVEFQQEMMEMLENGGKEILIIFSILQIVLNLFIIKIATKHDILDNKGKLMAISLICALTAESSLVAILSIINLVVLVFSKRKTEDYLSKEKNKIPQIEYRKSTKKEIIFGLIFVLAYFSIQIIGPLLPKNISQMTIMIISIIYYISLFVLAIVCFKDKLKQDIKLFKDNAKGYIMYILPKVGIMYVINAIANIICVLITQQGDSLNQEAIEAMPLWFSIPAAVIWAPLVEEAIFRGVLRRFIGNNKLFIVTSAAIFGLLHTITEATILNIIVMAVPYAIMGACFAYLYAKTNNITTNILAHTFCNTIAMTMSVITSFIIL